MRSPSLVRRRGLLALCLSLIPALANGQDTDRAQQTVRAIRIEGSERFSEDQILRALGIELGKPYTEAELDRAVEVLFDTFHVFARIYERPVEDGVELRVLLDELPLDLEPRFLGNVEIDTEELLEWAGLSEDEELYLYQAQRVRERLLERYRQEGFYFVEIEVVQRGPEEDPDSGMRITPDVIFEIREGPKVRVRKVVLQGDEFLPDRGFLFFKRGLSKLARVELRKPRFFRLFAKAFVTETLEADIVAMREVYRDFGFLDAVVELERLEFNENRTWVTIHIAIDEGGRYAIGSLDLEAVELFEQEGTPSGVGDRPAELLFPKEDLLGLLKLRVGEVYERRLQRDDERELRKRYGTEGYVDHQSLPLWDRWIFLEPELTFEADAPVVHVVYRIAQGRPIFIREIPITGVLHTKDRVVRRLITVEPGDRADTEEIERSRTRLQSSGLFSSERDPNHVEPRYRFIDTEDPAWKDLEFIVDEGDVLTFNVAGGISSNQGAFGVLTLSHRNFDLKNLPDSPWSLVGDVASREAFHGAGQELTLQASPGTEVSYFDIFFREPDLFGSHTDRISLSLNAQSRLRRFDSHDEERERVGFELGRLLTPDSSVFAGFNYGNVDVDDFETGGEPSLGSPLAVPEDLKAQEGESDLAYITLGYRASATDNRRDPRNGVSFVFKNDIYDQAWGSDFDFVKSDVQFDWYDELDEDPDIVSPFFHLGLGGGVAVPYGDTDEVPYTERFYLGGQSTLRGFQYRGVGPNENGFPIGGQTYLYGTLEYRHPLVKDTQPGTYRELETVRGGLFLDAGVIDPDDFSLETDELRMSAGFLFGLAYPIPVTFSFGWPLRDGPGDRHRVVGFSIEIF